MSGGFTQPVTNPYFGGEITQKQKMELGLLTHLPSFFMHKQVSGRFTQPVTNPYFGGEITQKMELGLLAKGFARTILAFIRAINSDMKHR